MDGNESFDRFLTRLLEAVEQAGWLESQPDTPYTDLDGQVARPGGVGLDTRGVGREEEGGGGEDAGGAGEGDVPDLGDVEQVLDRMIDEEGTAWIDGRASAPARTLLEPDHREAVRRRARRVVETTDDYPGGLADPLTPGAGPDVLFALLLSLLHAPRWAAVLTRLNGLLDWYEKAIAISVITTVERLGQNEPEHQLLHDLCRALRRGRIRLEAAVRDLALDTRMFEHTHQAILNRQLTALADRRAEWQAARLVAALTSGTPPTPAELESFERLQELTRRRRELDDAIRAARGERTIKRRTTGSSSASRQEREDAREWLREWWPRIREMEVDRRTLSREIGRLGRELGRDTRRRIEQYREAQRRGVRREDARVARDRMLARLDGRLSGHIRHRLMVESEEGRWRRYELLLGRLLSNPYGIAVELFMDSFLKSAQYVDRTREIGLVAHRRGHVQWLTYPGHGDNAVDWNCGAGLELDLAVPERFVIPRRYRLGPPDEAEHRLSSSRATARVSGSNDLQDIFGKIAYGLLGPGGSRREALSRILRENEGREVAPPDVVSRRFSGAEVSRLIVGLAARNLTSLDNASAFDALRRGILETIEREVLRREGLTRSSMMLFDRSRLHADSGAFGIGRFIVNVRPRDLLRHVSEMLSSRSSSPFSAERVRLINRIWRLLLWMRSAGAEPHRSAASATVQHTYGTDSGSELIVEVYYTHLHRVRVGAGGSLRPGQRIGLTGSTGNAVNSHVHIEIRLLRDGRQLGACLPHEFFPLVRLT